MSIQLAEQFEENEQYEEAYEEYKKSYEKSPKDLSLLERLGHVAMVLKRPEEAAEYYSKVLELDATNPTAYEQLMDIYFSTDKYKYYIYRGNRHSIEHQLEHAVNDYKKALAFAEDDKQIVMTRFTIATLLEQIANPLKAIDEYLKLLEYDATPEDAYLRLANLYVKEDAPASAADILERGIKKGFNNSRVKETLAQLYLKSGQPQKAKETTENELFKIKCMFELNELDEGFAELERIKEKYKNKGEYHTLLAHYYFLKYDYDKALECVTEYGKYEKNSPLLFQMRAMIYENKNDDFNAHLNWGKYNLLRGNKDIAINEFLSADRIDDTNADLTATLAALMEESGDKTHAMEFYEKLVKLEPDNKLALSKVAEYRENIGDYRTAADCLEKLYELDGKNTIVIKKLAETYEKLRNKPAAIEFYNKYIERARGLDDYEKVKAKIAKLENSNMVEDVGLMEKIIKFFNKDK